MPRSNDAFLEEVSGFVAQGMNASFPAAGGRITSEDIEKLITRPPEFKFGQAALPCHSFAKILRLSPVKIAETLANFQSPGRKFITKVEAVNGYLNFHCDFQNYGELILDQIATGEIFRGPQINPSAVEKILVEYSQPNTHKALHVGHLRNMVFGDAVCKTLEYAGHKVVHATYPGDFGAHIAKSLLYIKTFKMDQLAIEEEKKATRANWLGEMYCEADQWMKSKEGTPEEATLRTGITEVLSDLQENQGDYYDLYLKTREWSLEQMRAVYAWLGIHFDVWYYESECDVPSRELVKKKFADGFFQKSDGAIGLDLTAFNLGFAMYLKSDGNGLYLTKDLELIRRKFEDPAVTRSLVVVDTRQKLHFQQLFKTAELMGYPQAAKSEHLAYETVTNEKGEPFSSRTLNGMPLAELRRLMEEKVVKDYLESYRGNWSDEEIARTAEIVTLGALKYGFLKVDGNNIIRFVADEWLRLDGETGPYLQYTHARGHSILEKVGQPKSGETILLETDVEKELVYHLGRWNEFAVAAAEARRPSVVAAYLYDLCKTFNRFYRDCPIKDAEPKLKNSRLVMVRSVLEVLKKGLGVLGIPVPNRM